MNRKNIITKQNLYFIITHILKTASSLFIFSRLFYNKYVPVQVHI